MNYSNSKVTLELREIVNGVDADGNKIELFDFEYPSYYKGDAKKAFEQKVIDHYYFHQIGFETVGRFKHYLKVKLNDIMPYYLQLYKTQEIMDGIDDPFGNVDVTETYQEQIVSTNQASSHDTSVNQSEINGTTDNQNVFSNTPQGSISNIERYMSEANKGSSNTSQTSEGSLTNEGETTTTGDTMINKTFHKTGNQGVNTYAHDMIEYRESLINIDLMVIDDLRDLFLMVY